LEEFPEKLLTEEEIRRALELIRSGYKHELEIRGSEEFREAVEEALGLVEVAGYGDLLRTYIRAIAQVEGFSQLRPEEATIWLNVETLKNPVLAASFLVQKALQMKRYLEGKPFYGHKCEMELSNARYEFVRALREKTTDEKVRKLCDAVLAELDASLYDLVP